MFERFNPTLNTTINIGKLVVVNTATVYINGNENPFNSLAVIQAYNSDIHLNGILVFYTPIIFNNLRTIFRLKNWPLNALLKASFTQRK